jgi:hypothetical protein
MPTYEVHLPAKIGEESDWVVVKANCFQVDDGRLLFFKDDYKMIEIAAFNKLEWAWLEQVEKPTEPPSQV